MEIKAIFMDFYGTVVREAEESLIAICHKIKEASKIDATFEEIAYYWTKEFNHLLMASHGEQFQKQRDVSTASIRNTMTKFHSSATEDELLEKMFYQWKNPIIYSDALEFFEKNKLPVYILSNVDQADITEAIKVLGLRVEGVITSEDVKAYKPHPHIFQYALKQNGFSPGEVLHVGDSLTSDVQGANQVGINSVWLNRSGKPVTGPNQPNYMIHSLNELIQIYQN
jgi:2-haloalkanoic acid dehalogenase type II